MTLTEYQRKRHFDKTPEPAGKPKRQQAKTNRAAPGRRATSFVVQKHDATRLHYDFRLEHDGVLLSWAVPKGPSLDPAEKRLAVHVEDHPLDYAKFEGQIPEGEYGAGEVIVWDRGTWTPENDPARGLASGKLEFELHGKKLHGKWRLIRLAARSPKDKDNWLLIKRRDDAARPLSEYDVLTEAASVKTGRRLAVDGGGPVRRAKATKSIAKRKGTKRRPRANKRSARRKKAAKSAVDAQSLELQLATLVSHAPSGSDWLHEIKFDGYRLLARVDAGTATLFTRRHLDGTARYPVIAEAVSALPVDSALLDGEVVALLPSGVSSFQLLQNAGRDGAATLVYYAFDLLELDGEDLRPLPLVERKERLAAVLRESSSSQVQLSEHYEDDGPSFLKACCQRGLEGIISKRRNRPYIGGRSGDWLKIKCLGLEELVIGGFTPSSDRLRAFGALLVGYFENDQLIYAGRIGTGFSSATLADLGGRLAKLERVTSPFESLPPREKRSRVRWVRPELVAQVEFTAWTDDGVLRHPSFQGLREDKPAQSIGRPESLQLKEYRPSPPEETAPMPASAKPRRRSSGKSAGRKPALQPLPSELPVRLTNPDRVLFVEPEITKLELAQYYTQIADWILPHLADRPLSMLRCPEGHRKHCFFQKHAGPGTPEELRRIDIEESDGVEEYLIADDLAGLLSLAQMSILEIHPWGSRADRLEFPDRLFFDLDPDEKVPWEKTVETAFVLRDMLERLDLASYIKTTGGKGLHVVVPISVRRHEWPLAKEFSRAVATHLAEQNPDQYVVTSSKAARWGKIFIDYLRNDRGATAVAPYSTRAKPGAPISMPLAWDELTPKLRSDHFHLRDAIARLKSLKRDPWHDFFTLKQSLPKFVADRS